MKHVCRDVLRKHVPILITGSRLAMNNSENMHTESQTSSPQKVNALHVNIAKFIWGGVEDVRLVFLD